MDIGWSDARRPGIRSRSAAVRWLARMAGTAFPTASAVALLLLLTAPFGLPGQAAIQAALVTASVFFWTTTRPQAMPAPVVFGLGLVGDLLGSAPFGTGLLRLLLVHALVRGPLRWSVGGRLDPDSVGGGALWAGFAAIAAVSFGVEWAIVSLLEIQIASVAAGASEWLIAVGLYPAIGAALAWTDRRIVAPRGA